jgi:hypothetical protein
MGSFSGPLPENIRKAMAPEVRKELKAPTNEESALKYSRKTEKTLHDQFIAFCRRNCIDFVHSRMDKKPTIKSGWPDFTCIKNNKVALIEFKSPGGELSVDQFTCILDLARSGTDVLVATSLHEAIDYVFRKLAKS